MEHNDPQLATITTSIYNDNFCSSKGFHHLTGITAAVKRSDSVSREYEFHVQDAFFAVSEEYLTHLNCSGKVKPNHSYSLKAHHCVDEKGENPFVDVEKDIGEKLHYSIEFFDDALHLHYVSAEIAIPRASSEGCDRPFSLLASFAEYRNIALIFITGVVCIAAIIATALFVNRKRRMTSEAEMILV